MQLMPGTAAGLGVKDSFQPDQNVRGGSTYLDALLTHYHDNLALALAAYNAGPEAVDKYHGIPPYRETRAYVARVIHEFNRRVLAREAEARRTAASAKATAASAMHKSDSRAQLSSPLFLERRLPLTPRGHCSKFARSPADMRVRTYQ